MSYTPGEIIAAVLLLIFLCFPGGAIDAYLEERKWEKARRRRESGENRHKEPDSD